MISWNDLPYELREHILRFLCTALIQGCKDPKSRLNDLPQMGAIEHPAALSSPGPLTYYSISRSFPTPLRSCLHQRGRIFKPPQI